MILDREKLTDNWPDWTRSNWPTYSVAETNQTSTTYAGRKTKINFGGTGFQPLVYLGPIGGTVGQQVTLEATFQPPGQYAVTASFGGDEDIYPSTVSSPFTITAQPTQL